MTKSPPGGTPDGLQRMIARLDRGHLTDGQLLARYLGERDEAAFAELVRRHGPLVYGVSRRRLGPGPDADDVFQATFLVLYRKAGGLAGQQNLGGWLLGVAARMARKAQASAAKRRAREVAAARPEAAPELLPADDAVEQLLGAVARLPARYQEAVVLCELEGRPRKDAAAALGIPEGTLASRLAYARRRLADRLTRGGTLAVPVPAILFASAASAGGAGADPAARLAAEEVRAMVLFKWGVGVGLAAVAVTAGGLALSAAGQPPTPERPSLPAAAGRGPLPAAGWRAEFQRAYGLADGQVLKRVGPPYPGRARLFDPSEPGHLPNLPRSPAASVLCYRSDGKQTTHWGLCGCDPATGRIGTSLATTLDWAVGFPPQAVEGDQKLLEEFVEGEFVLRTGAKPQKWVPELDRILRDECRVPVKLTLREVTREAVVTTGRWTLNSHRPPRAGDPVAVRLSPGQVTWGRGGGGSGEFDQFLDSLGAHLNRHVVSDTTPPPAGVISWSFDSGPPGAPPPADRRRALDADLRAVEVQTGLTFRVEDRKVWVLEVTRAAPRGP